MGRIMQMREELADREAIRDVMYRYLRAGDRHDLGLLASVFWPDATYEHSLFTGTAQEWIAMMDQVASNVEVTHHTVGNILIEIDGDVARSESYYRAAMRMLRVDGGRYDLVTSGRYLDVLVRRDDEWRFSSRTVVRDWFREYPDAAGTEASVLGSGSRAGTRDLGDPSYALFGALERAQQS